MTIVVRDRECALGEVKDDTVVLSALGAAAADCWKKIPQHHAGVELDEYLIMPNHVHGIIIINDLACRDVQLNVPTKANIRRSLPVSPRKGSLSVIVRTFKAAVTTWARNNGFGYFGWQARFHDHIIRNEADLHRIRTYVANNPLQWAIDEENPECVRQL